MEILTAIKEILTIASIIVAAIIAFPFVKKKILDDKLKTSIDEITNTNKKGVSLVQSLIEKYSFRNDLNRPISIKELQNMYCDALEIKKAFLLSQGEVATLSISLESFLRRTIHWYKKTSSIILVKSDVYSIVLSTINDIYFFLLKNVPVPKHSFIHKESYINKGMLKYTKHATVNMYKDFEVGQISDVTSAIYPLFYNNINKHGNYIFYRAMFDTYGMDIQYFIVRLIYLRKIYAPIVLNYNDPMGFGNYYLLLVGFKISKTLGRNESTVTLYYVNPNSSMHYIMGLNNIGIQNFDDIYLKLGNKLSPSIIKSMRPGYNEMVEIQVLEDKLNSYYRKYKHYIIMKMRDEIHDYFD